jgi:hypothetical protein
MAKKMTIVEQYEAIIGKVEGILTEEEIAFLKERAEMVAKKNANRKPTKAQEENEGYKSSIIEGMEKGKAYTITDLIKSVPAIADLTNQRVSALVRQLKDEGAVTRKEEKGKAYFTLA